MNNSKENDYKNFTRGGQIILHNFRMFLQVIDKVLWAIFIMFLVVLIILALLYTTEYERYVVGEYLISGLSPILNPNAGTDFIQPNGSKIYVSYSAINHSLAIKEIVRQAGLNLIKAMILSIIISGAVFTLVTRILRWHGIKQSEAVLIKGDRILSSEETKYLIKKRKLNSDLILAGLPLIKNKEMTHFLFHGSTGTGKSSAIKELLDQIRRRGDRAIIYDKSCGYLEQFFDPSKDHLLNPLDERGNPWDLWQECRDSADFDSLAAAQIPMPLSTQDPFWINAARTIFSAAAYAMRNDKDRSITKLLKYLLSSDLEIMQNYLKGTEAESLVSDKIEKTAISIKSVLATYLKSLKHVRDGEGAFSIRKWIQDDKEKNWLFITSLGDRHETLKPLISTWIDIAVNALLSLSPHSNRRIWLILDELTSLHPLPYLTGTLSEGRKFGGCIVIAVQNYAQLSKLYGVNGAKEISSLLNTRFMFRQPDPELAHWSADNFGESVLDETREGISYGANSMRDGVSINRVEHNKPLISKSQILGLADFKAFVRLPGEIPITTVSFKYKERENINIGLVERRVDSISSIEIDDLIDRSRISFLTASEEDNTEPKKVKKAKQITVEKRTKDMAIDV